MPHLTINKYKKDDGGAQTTAITSTSASVLLLPGLYYSEAAHWTTYWQLAYGYKWLAHDQWQQPLRGDWLVRLEDTVQDLAHPVIAVAHGLGCLQLAAWAMHSKSTKKISAALLVEPTDVTLTALQPRLWSWQTLARQPLPMPSMLVGCDDDFGSSSAFSCALAKDWGALWVDGATCGYSAMAAKGNWPEGQKLLKILAQKIN